MERKCQKNTDIGYVFVSSLADRPAAG